MGLAVARALSERGGWVFHNIPITLSGGVEVTNILLNATFHRTTMMF